eukprot:CAMPEP_0183489872 /NCGR_PEP_ID=MMETSP0370-20130417/181660_1 /TAXON_ID=268820 /ORGANISM="Peridinium aciculiferum, Strain PAER-2" /LENGTH=343 /DNA_ID=CAMNT_0025683207 /DNA_START=65 /DNA_END=1096 /DNA_ORIENTATION=-
MTRVLTGFALVGAAWATASPPAADVAAAEAMNADDECAAAAGGAGCAVNAMQMRALKKEEAPAVQPLYCTMLPAGISSPFCSPGVTTCGCQAYCATASPTAGISSPFCSPGVTTCGCQAYCATASPTSYGWDPNCCSCAGSPCLAPAVALNQVLARKATVPVVHPIFCANMPAGVSSPFCSPGINGCKCEGYCYMAAPSSYGWDPNCCMCKGSPSLPTAVVPTALVQEVSAITKEGNQPIYCQHLPAGVTSTYCTPGVNTCKCQGYCATASPTSFGWDPNCCSCAGITAAPPRAPASIAPAAGGSCAAYGCTGAYTAAHPCQCNSQCAAHNNCCGDYTSKCGR